MKRNFAFPIGFSVLIGAAVGVGPALADVAVGDVITAANVDKAGDLISPGIKWIVERGMKMTIVETETVPLPKAYLAATEKYSAQVKLAADGLSVEDWVAGQPFPNLDANDPDLPKKIMYNYDARWGETDDVDVSNFDADTGVAFDQQVTGLQVIEEKRFDALPDETVLEWRHRGWLPLVYWHWISMDNFLRFARRG